MDNTNQDGSVQVPLRSPNSSFLPTTLRPSIRSACAASVTILCCVLLFAMQGPATSGETTVLQAAQGARWYRGNIHTHSLWSDGDDYLEMIALWYKDHNYQFLVFTDHNVLANRERWSDVDGNKGQRRAYDKLKARFPKDWVEERMVEKKPAAKPVPDKAKNEKPTDAKPAAEKPATEKPTDEGPVEMRLEVRLKTFDEVARKFNIPGDYLLIQGEEITDKFNKLPIHMNATNVKEPIPPLGGESMYDVMQNNTNAVIAQRERTKQPMLVHVNHPNFGWALTAEDLMRVRGENFFEVYNGHPGVNNAGDAERASTDRIWDIMLTRRIAELDLPLMYGLANDDGHNYHDIPSRTSEPGRGWVMVLAQDLNPGSLIEALEAGRFYASSGVFLEKVATDAKGMALEVKAEPGVSYTIDFIGTRKGYDPASTPVLDKAGKPLHTTRRYSDDIGKTLKTVDGNRASYEFTGDELYVRARVTSTKLHPNPSTLGEFERAWGQPLRGPGAPKQE